MLILTNSLDFVPLPGCRPSWQQVSEPGEVGALAAGRAGVSALPRGKELPDFGSLTPCLRSLESWMFLKPEPGFSELEKKLKSFSQKSAVLKEVLLEFKGEPDKSLPGTKSASQPGSHMRVH